ncbi:MAG TPA: sensor histidine kinase [Bacteroidota bacterium]|nr:sensor histidine kinase [Bacteroidota bacterium]
MRTRSPRIALGFKISLLLIVSALGSTIALSYLFIAVSQNATEALLKENYIGISNEISQRLRSTVDYDMQSLKYVVDILNDGDLPDQLKIRNVESVLRNSRDLNFLAVYDDAGKLIDVQKPHDFTVPAALPEILKPDSATLESGIMGGAFLSSSDSMPYLRILVPWDRIVSGRSERLGFVLTYLSLAPLSRDVSELSRQRFGRTDMVFVLDDSARIIASGNVHQVKTRANVSLTDLFTSSANTGLTQLFRRDVGFSKVYTNLSGQRMLGSFKTLPRLRLGVLVEESYESAFATVEWMRTQLIYWTLVAAGIAILIGMFFARTITRPLRVLVTATHEVASGNYGHDLPITTRDEVAEVTESFNKMSENLQKSFEELRQANEHIVKAEKMASRGEIVVEVSHELKNFLHTLLLQTHTLKTMLNRFDAETFGQLVAKVESGLHRMSNFSENLLTRGSGALNLQHVDINEVASTFVSFVKLLPKFRKGTIETELAPGRPGAMIDVDQLRQVFLNLTKNSIEARRDATIRFVVAQNEERREVKIDIVDNGPGIPAEVLAKLFKERITTKPDGHGFGLPICQKIIEAQHGSIAVNSVVNGGTTFTITFPLLAEPPPAEAGS